ncbi:MAG: hypothetical protein WD826_03635, partial [Actinomycetota bacterium]
MGRGRNLAFAVLVAGVLAAPPIAVVGGSSGACPPGSTEIGDTGTCTHGFDPADTTAVAPARRAAAANTLSCEGDGQSGRRIQVLYLYQQGSENKLDDVRATLQQRTKDVDDIIVASAAKTGGTRHGRFVTTSAPDCFADVRGVAVSASSLNGDFNTLAPELAAKGFDRFDRKYLTFSDKPDAFAGGIAQWIDDDSPDPVLSSQNNSALHAMVFKYNPNVPAQETDPDLWWSARSAAHELGHILGAVQNSAPRTSGGSHCNDGLDVMCYNDG